MENLLNSTVILAVSPSSLLENLENVVMFIGAGVGAFGLFTLVQALKDHNPNAKSSAFMEIGCGLVTIALAKPIVEFIISYLPQ